ncbi:MAG TPA: amino acid aminotransferase [Candidatus Limnocylindrales bacterium]|nr:amino acid aminotransferase [Candidatus Limnocylindrales bacterium]
MSLPSLARVPAPPDPILGLADAIRADTREGRINLTAGVFIDATGKTPVLDTVIEAERRLAAEAGTKLYRPIDGEVAYRDLVTGLALGPGHEAVVSKRALATQTPGGTGGLRVAADLIRSTGGGGTIWLSEPTWPNHPQLFTAAGFRIRSYPYTDATGRRIDEAAMLGALAGTAPGDVVLLHGACHNPTGVDPSPELWRRIGDLVAERGVLPLVDLAYQGFGDGLAEDAAGLRELVRPGAELIVSTSFSKTFSLYAERVGAMIVVAKDAADAAAVQSNVKMAVRVNYSNPPAHGADIVRTILADPDLRARWEVELAGMRNRIKDNRRALVQALEERSVPGDWSVIAGQRGMFALLGLSPAQVARLRDEHAVYVVGGGRINVAGFTDANLGPFADALAAVLAS